MSQYRVQILFQLGSNLLSRLKSVSLSAARLATNSTRRTAADIGMEIPDLQRIVVQEGSIEYILILDSKNADSPRVGIPA
jgi:hypothetical protein